jgi:branched-subunit amino acid aminotransferase/4-amino-4-deoxychorismate lyase
VNDAIFVTEQGVVTEATAANVFIIRRGTLVTPPNSPDLLPGITRDKLLRAAVAAGVPVAESEIHLADLLGAAEVFLSSTTAEVVPVVCVNGQNIGTGRPGPVTARIYAKFVELLGGG